MVVSNYILSKVVPAGATTHGLAFSVDGDSCFGKRRIIITPLIGSSSKDVKAFGVFSLVISLSVYKH